MHRGSKLRAKTEENYPDHTGGNSGDATYGKVKFTYDPAGRMIRREDQKGDTVTFNHTMAGTIMSRNYRTSFCRIGWAANSPSGTIPDSDTFTFDNLGRMLTAVSGRYTNIVTMTYVSYGRLKDESLTLAGQTYTVTRAYDTRSRLTQLTYPNGSIVQRTYTTRSQLHTVRYLGTTVDTRTYDDGGRLGTSTYANGAVVSFAYRNDNLPTSIVTTHCRGSLRDPILLPGSNYWPAARHCRGSLRDPILVPGLNCRPAARHCRGSLRDPILVRGANHYTSTGYDDEDRLQTWNRTHSNAHEFTGFTGASTGTLAYDVKSNQTSRPSTLSAPALNLDWNFDNQLRGADTNGSAGSLEVTFEYDALGRRVSRSHSSGNVVYVHAGQQVIADYARGAVTSSPTYRYVYADYVDEPIVRHTGTATTLPTTGDIALYYHRNQQYSIIGLTNAAGTLVERYSYTAYGTLGIYDASGTVRTTSIYANRYTYTGREYDPDLNLYHFRARWYDPSTGGFISRDPLGYVDGMSLYRGYFADSSSLDWSGSTSTTTGSGWVWHHLVPWELFPEARRVAYHINDPCNGWGLPQDLHKELHDLGWNDDWIAWYEGFREKGKWPTQQDFIDQVNRMKSAPKYRSIIERGVQATFEYPGTYTRKCRGDYLVPGCNGKPKLGPGAYGAGIIFMSPFFSQVVDAADVVQKACGPVMVVCGMCDAELDALEEAMKRFYSPGGMSQFNCQAIIYAYEVMANCAGLPTLGAEYTAAFGKCSEIVTVDRASQPYYVAPPVPLIDGPPGVVSRSIDD